MGAGAGENMSNTRSGPVTSQPDVSILIVGYNSADLIGKCVGSIPSACEHFNYEVLLVDQGDGKTEALVAERFPFVSIVPSKGNLGFAGGNNLLANEATGKYLLLLNPDVELRPGAIDTLLEAAKRYSEASAWGGVTIDSNGTPDIGVSVHVPSLSEMAKRVLGRSSLGPKAGESYEMDTKVEMLSGSFVLICHDAWRQAGGLDERYFLYGEEVDFFYRLSLKGHSFWRIGTSRAYHKIAHGGFGSPTRALYAAAGLMQFARIHWSFLRQFAAFVLTWLGALQRYTLGVLLKGFDPQRGGQLINANRAVAFKPNHWRNGYDPDRGLLTKLSR